MTFYCPECGTEVTNGVKCPSCGHMDEQCDSCGEFPGDAGWFCQQCDSPRGHCPECGHQLDSDGCTECDARRPAVCESCNERVERGTVECPSCGHNPGAAVRSRAKKAKYVGFSLPVLVIILAGGGGLAVRAASGDPILSASNIGFVFAWVLLITIFLSGPLLLLARRWRRKSNTQSIETVPS